LTPRAISIPDALNECIDPRHAVPASRIVKKKHTIPKVREVKPGSDTTKILIGKKRRGSSISVNELEEEIETR
jgi:hypothetical protein